LRKAAGVSQEAVARQTGITLKAFGELERGEVQDPHYSTLRDIANALDTSVAELVGEKELAAPLADAPVGAEELGEVLDRIAARSRHLSDANLVRSLQSASDAAVRRTVREVRQELALLMPELEYLGKTLGPQDAGYMRFNKAHSWVSGQVLALKIFLMMWDEPEAKEAAADVRARLGELAKVG